MKIKRGNDNGIYAVFNSEDDAWKYHHIFRTILRRDIVCFGGYLNAWKLI